MARSFNTRKSGVNLETFAMLRVCVFVYACVFVVVLDGEIIFVKICNGACVAGSTGSTEFVSTLLIFHVFSRKIVSFYFLIAVLFFICFMIE